MILHVPNALTPPEDDRFVTVASTVTVQTHRLRADDFGRLVRALVMKAVLHEVDEQLLVDGRQLDDPHARDKVDPLKRAFEKPMGIDEHERVMREASDREQRRLDEVFRPLRGLL